MSDVVFLFLHLIVTIFRLARPGGLRSVVAESLLVKHQLQILKRGRKFAWSRPYPQTEIIGARYLGFHFGNHVRWLIFVPPGFDRRSDFHIWFA